MFQQNDCKPVVPRIKPVEERADVRQRQNQAQSVVCVYTSFPQRGSAGFGKHFQA